MSGNRWRSTHAIIYRAIYGEYHEDLVVFSSHTCMEGCEWHDEPTVLTEWGFRESHHPIIRSIGKGPIESRTFEYWILESAARDDD